MSTTTRVNKRDAERVLAAVKRTFRYAIDPDSKYGPKLIKDWNWGWTGGGHDYAWAIVWEEGPFEWTYRFPDGDVDEELTAELHTIVPDAPALRSGAATLPDDVWTEPITSWALAIYPKDWA